MAMTASLKSHVEQTPYDADPESGYASASSAEVVTSRDGLFSKQYLRFINRQLQLWEPQGQFDQYRCFSVLETRNRNRSDESQISFCGR